MVAVPYVAWLLDFCSAYFIKRLFLDSNAIAVIEPDAFKSLTELTQLDLSGNKISSLTRHRFDDLHK